MIHLISKEEVNREEIEITPTPWDEKAFGIKTFDIKLPVFSENQLSRYTDELKKNTTSEGSSLYYCRIDSNLVMHKKLLSNSGFYYCESQLHIIKTRLSSYVTPVDLGKKRLQITPGVFEDYQEISSVSSDVFKYSRFHEDPFLDKFSCDRRMSLWTTDLGERSAPLLVARNAFGKLDSFMFYKKINEKKVELVLGGSLPGKGMLTPFFWASCFEYFSRLGVDCIETKISAANLVILNTYIYFGFSVKQTLLDYHKLIN